MTKMFATNAQNDIYLLPDGNLAIVTDQDAVEQACRNYAQAQLGEMVLAIDQGVANFQTVWRDAANIAQFEAYVRRAIRSVPGVIEIEEFSASVQNNVVQYSATIKTIYGRSAING